MRTTVWALVLLSGVVLPGGQSPTAQSQTTNSPPGQQLIHIDGSVHPELLPQWVVWEQTFNQLDGIKRHNITAALQTLDLTDAEAAVVFREAGGQSARRDECAATNDKITNEYRAKGLSLEVMLLAQRPAILKYRTDILEARDRIEKALGKKGRRSLDAFVARVIQGIGVDVWSSDLAFFKLPR